MSFTPSVSCFFGVFSFCPELLAKVLTTKAIFFLSDCLNPLQGMALFLKSLPEGIAYELLDTFKNFSFASRRDCPL